MASTDPYARTASYYDRLIEPMQAGVRRIAVGIVPPQPGWRVLDVGCGTGTGLVPYVAAGCRADGVDTSPAMLEQAGRRLGDGAQLHLTEGDSLPFEDDRFDLVTTAMVLHEVPSSERGRFLSEMARVTNPDGVMLLIDFHFGSLRGWRGPLLRGVSSVMERFSGHHSGYRSFRAEGGVPGLAERAGLGLDQQKVVAGGNVAISVVRTST